MREANDDELLLALRFADIVLPDYAVDCEPWEWDRDAWRRLFTVREWQVAAIMVSVSGEQTHHGGILYWIYVGGEDQFTCLDRRSLLEALNEAGALLDSLIVQ